MCSGVVSYLFNSEGNFGMVSTLHGVWQRTCRDDGKLWTCRGSNAHL
jgi:hypothetical protein